MAKTLSAVFERTGIGFAAFDRGTRRAVESNPRLAALLGRSSHELAGFPYGALFAPASRAEAEEAWQRVAAGAAEEVLETTLAVPAGEARVRLGLRRLTDIVVVSAEDLQRAPHVLRDLVATASRHFSTSGPDFKTAAGAVTTEVAAVLADVCSLHVLSDDGKWLRPVAFHARDPQILAASIDAFSRDCLRTDEGFMERVLETRRTLFAPEVSPDVVLSAGPRPFRSTVERHQPRSLVVAPLHGRGKVVGVLSLCRVAPGNPFTSEDRRAAEEIASLAASAFQNARLHEAALARADDLAEEAAERAKALGETHAALEAFAAAAVLDPRAPLKAVRVSARLLGSVRDIDPAEIGKRAARIEENADAVTTLLDDLLDFSRAAVAPVKRGPVALGRLAASILKGIASRNPSHRVAVRVDETAHASCDPGLVPLALENLLEAAWKAASGGAAPAVEFARHPASEGFLVRHNGPGIDPAKAKKAFEPFERGAPFPGAGLATARRIVERHGGRMWIENGPEGTAFCFTLDPG